MDNSKEQIMSIALSLFLKKPYKEVSIQEITDTMGVTKGAFYYYFKSKEELFSQITDQYLIMNQLNFEKLNTNSLNEFYHSYFDCFTSIDKKSTNKASFQEDINHYFLTFDALKLLPDFRKKISDYEQKEINAWVEMISKAKKNGEIKSNMTDIHIAKIFIYTADGIGMRKIIQNKSGEILNEVVKLWDEFYKLLKG